LLGASNPVEVNTPFSRGFFAADPDDDDDDDDARELGWAVNRYGKSSGATLTRFGNAWATVYTYGAVLHPRIEQCKFNYLAGTSVSLSIIGAPRQRGRYPRK